MKYELTKEKMNVNGYELSRIKALKSFSDVTIGDLGGFIHSESNLSQTGNCWVYDMAMVCNDCDISENATVHNDVKLFNAIHLKGDVSLTGDYNLLGDFCIATGTVTTPPITITGMWFDVVITDEYMGIACQYYGRDFWRGLTEEQADAIGVEGNFKPNSIWAWWQENGAAVMAVAEVHWAKVV